MKKRKMLSFLMCLVCMLPLCACGTAGHGEAVTTQAGETTASPVVSDPISASDSQASAPDTSVTEPQELPEYSVLFIGNSYTYYNDMPAMFRSLVESAGGHVMVNSITNGGQLSCRLHALCDRLRHLAGRH